MPQPVRKLLAARYWTTRAGTSAWARVVQRWGLIYLLVRVHAGNPWKVHESGHTDVYTVPSDLRDLVLRCFDLAPDPVSESDPNMGTYWDYLLDTVVPKLIYCGPAGSLPWTQDL